MKMLSLAALAATLLVAPALAQDPAPEYRTHIVSYSDLDLGTAAGIARLDRRIRTAVQDVCGTASNLDVAGSNEVRACRIELTERLSAHREQAIASAAKRPAAGLAASR